MYSVQKTITHISSSRHTQKVIDIYQGNREQLNVSVDCFSYHCIMNNFCSIVFIYVYKENQLNYFIQNHTKKIKFLRNE